MSDKLGNRMKEQYEDRAASSLPRRTYTLIRADGKAFHTLTRDCEKPFDRNLSACLDGAATILCTEAQGSCFAYLQSDEISLLLTDFATEQTGAWFNGNIQKMASVAASIVTAVFNRTAAITYGQSYKWSQRHAYFDARVWTIPDPTEVENYFIWRQQDAVRNSLQMLARSHFSHGELDGKGGPEIHEMLYSKGINWNDLPTDQKQGRTISHEPGSWIVNWESPIFTSDEGRAWLKVRIPRYV